MRVGIGETVVDEGTDMRVGKAFGASLTYRYKTHKRHT